MTDRQIMALMRHLTKYSNDTLLILYTAYFDEQNGGTNILRIEFNDPYNHHAIGILPDGKVRTYQESYRV